MQSVFSAPPRNLIPELSAQIVRRDPTLKTLCIPESQLSPSCWGGARPEPPASSGWCRVFEKSPRSFNERLLFEPEKHDFQPCDDAEVTMSPLTRYLSRLLGVFLMVMAASEWTQPGLLTVVAPAMVDQPALLWVSGILTFAVGLAIVLGHNVWGDPAAVVVSLLGWMMTIKGAALLLVPAAGWTALLGAMHYPSHSGVYTIIPALAGAYLTYSGFARRRQQRAGRESAQRP
jgi:hypothetical protein